MAFEFVSRYRTATVSAHLEVSTAHVTRPIMEFVSRMFNLSDMKLEHLQCRLHGLQTPWKC